MKHLPLSLMSLSLLWTAPAFAERPSGVFTGTLGKSKIVACFDERAAAYYYLRIGVDIPLVRDKSGRWKERADDGKSTGTWKLEPLDTVGRRHWKNDDEGCSDSLTDDTTFVVRPSTDGMIFIPRLPHAIEACATEVTVPYAKLSSKLTAGRRATAEFAKMVK